MFCESQKPYVHFTMSDLIILPRKGAVTSCYNLGCGGRKPRAAGLSSAHHPHDFRVLDFPSGLLSLQYDEEAGAGAIGAVISDIHQRHMLF